MAIGSLVVKIGADISGLVRDGKRGADSLGKLEGATKKLGTVLRVLAVGIVVKKLVSLVSASMDAVDASAKLSRQLGGTINGLRGLQLAASDAGVDTGALTTGMEALNRKLGEAARKGAGEAFNALERLGLSARALGAMDLDERMATLADAMREAGLTSQETSDTLAQLGIRQAQVARIMLDGGDALRAGRIEMEAFGLAISEVDAAKIEAANDAMERIKIASTAIGQNLAVQLSPVITAISNQFLKLAKDAGGFKGTIATAIEISIKAVGFLGDSVRGLILVFKTVELAGWALGAALLKMFSQVSEAVTVNDNILRRVAVGLHNFLNDTDFTIDDLKPGGAAHTDLDNYADAFEGTIKAVKKQIEDMAKKEWPSVKAKRFFAEVQAAAQEAAESVIKSRKQIQFGGGNGEGTAEADTKDADALQAKLQSQLDMLREHIMSEEELENERHANRLQQLRNARAQELLTLAEFASLSEGIEKKHAETVANIREKGMEATNNITAQGMASNVRMLVGMADSLAKSLGRSAKEQFDIHKGFAIADALISGAQGVARTYGAFPYPVNIPMAIAHGALAAAQVGIIASQQFEGGGRRVMAPSAAAVPSAAPAGPQGGGPAAGGGVTGGQSGLAQINVIGENFGRSQVISLIEGINEAIGDGARLVVQ